MGVKEVYISIKEKDGKRSSHKQPAQTAQKSTIWTYALEDEGSAPDASLMGPLGLKSRAATGFKVG